MPHRRSRSSNAGTDQSIWAWDAKEPFGHELPNNNPSGLGAFTFNLRFPGQVFDEETGLFHNGYRDYHSKLGRYVQSDPLGLEAGWNTYGYVGGDPLRAIDPLGLDVYLCKQPAQIPILGYFVDHHWIKTDTLEAGMGGTRGNVPGNESGDLPGDPVQVVDHTGRHKEPGATCELVTDVNEEFVNQQLELNRKLGNWGVSNQCQSFARSVLENARVPSPGASKNWQEGGQ